MVTNAAAGLRAAVSVVFGDATIAQQRDAGVRARDLGRGISDQLGLARRISPQHAAVDVRLARQIHDRFRPSDPCSGPGRSPNASPGSWYANAST